MPRATSNPLTPETLTFLGELAEHNERSWFEANKGRYEDHVRHPALQLISDFGPRLRRVSRHFQAIPRTVKGSLMRIHRDVRFSPDKRPYKTNVGIRFPHEQWRDVHAPGFYLHVEPGDSFFGVGAWHPPSAALGAIRDAIVDTPERWAEVRDDVGFRGRFELGGETLKRAPRGYPKDHPYVEDLKRKDFVAYRPLSDDAIVATDLLDELEASCRAALPFVGFLCRANRLPA